MKDLTGRLWYGAGRPLWPLMPLAWLYRALASWRRTRLTAGAEPLPVPVVVVGNITAGGTGKSPLTAWLASHFRDQGWRPVILSRGYGGKRPGDEPLLVSGDSDPAVAGDEPVMLAAQTGCPVVVHPQRRASAIMALDQGLGNLFLCDDGLQHYALARDVEITVFDGVRGIGNGAGLPVGPLREPVGRLQDVDLVVVNGPAGPLVPDHPQRYAMTLQPAGVRHLLSGESTFAEAWLRGRNCVALAGIGNPGRFFDQLRHLGAEVVGRAFPDHHRYTGQDIATGDERPVLMTAKDAVKIRPFAHERCWVLDVTPELPESFGSAVNLALNSKLAARGLDASLLREI
ncbi:tetraacyldisaccharide 4'-kinase [Marinobacter bryozoorum]|uniref:tetraacyldisaccharide 4'-kinase n=1 Tax=Marinobacter bryozoorum TaxID=256324 RepID=UPI00200541CF|nr:tetraacyldisaccharide 4'-kinase [Marinobacter bryozoorum]MCK7544196.1 tetraacyldisaccharide 4'-kinase [Marinobacter bryozoorum]